MWFSLSCPPLCLSYSLCRSRIRYDSSRQNISQVFILFLFLWEAAFYHGVRRSTLQCQDLQLRLNTELWLKLLVILCGFGIYLRILESSRRKQCLYYVTIRQQSISLQIPPFMRQGSISRSIVILSGSVTWRELLSHCISRGSLNLQTSSPRHYHRLDFKRFFARWGFTTSLTPILRGSNTHEDWCEFGNGGVVVQQCRTLGYYGFIIL